MEQIKLLILRTLVLCAFSKYYYDVPVLIVLMLKLECLQMNSETDLHWD